MQKIFLRAAICSENGTIFMRNFKEVILLRRYIALLTAFCTASVLLSACGKAERSRAEIIYGPIEYEYETDEELLRSGFVTDENGVDYNILLDSDIFKSHVASYTEENPDAYAAIPVRPAVLSHEESLILPMNYFYLLIIDDGNVIGIENINLMEGRITPNTYQKRSGRISGGGVFNTVHEKGDMVLFTLGSAIYVMWEDNSVKAISFPEESEYTGSLTFDDLNQGYNLVSAEKLGEVFYSPSAEKDVEDAH